MKKNYSPIKIILFIAGFIIILAAAYLTYPIFTIRLWKHILIWFDVAFVYCAVFLPMVIGKRGSRDAARVFVGGAVYYRGVIIYAIISIVLIVIALQLIVSPVIIILAQCVVVLIFLVYFFLACFTTGHISEVERAENSKTAMVKTLKMQASSLQVKANGLGDEHKNVKDAAGRLADNMRYLSPTDDPEAVRLEQRMYVMIDSISTDPLFSFGMNTSSEQVMRKFSELNMLYEQRKNIL